MPGLGIIGGSGLYQLSGMERASSIAVTTPYGMPSNPYIKANISGKDIFFLPRHGKGHTIQPHKINYRANIWGFKQLGVERILSIGASGGISPAFRPGKIAAPDQIIDLTHGRTSTFYEEEEVVHVDFTNPFCPSFRRDIFLAAEESGVEVIRSGVYVCVNGPRLETAAEIRAFLTWGGDIVGMTAMPEAALAREAGICYAGISVITNFAAGFFARKLTTAEVVEKMEEASGAMNSLLEALFGRDSFQTECGCREALDGAGM